MKDIEIKQTVLDALIFMNTAIKNMRLYPPTSTAIIKPIERLHQSFLNIFEQQSPLIFAESERNILICGEPLNQKDQEKWQVTALLNILLEFGIKSITFDKGLENEELSDFLEILSAKHANITSESGLPQIMTEKNIQHIYLDEKVYVARDKNQQLLSSLNITDDQIIQFFMHAHPELEAKPQKIQEMAKNPEWVLQTFQSGLYQMMEQKGALSNLQLSEKIANMIAVLDKVAGPFGKKEQDKISQHIGKSIAAMEPDMIQQLKAKKMEHLFGGALMKYFTVKITEDKVVKTLTPTPGISVQAKKPEPVAKQEKLDPQNQIFKLKEKLRALPKDDQKPFLDAPMMTALPKIFEQLDAQKEHETMAIIINRLVGNLFSKTDDVRLQASTALAEIFEGLSRDRQNKLIEKLSDQLIDWIKEEPLATIAYKKICNNLKNLVQNYIREGRFTDAIPFLDVFSNISAGILEKDDKANEISLEIIRALASEENFNSLFKSFNTNNAKKQVKAGEVLVRLGDPAMNRVLDILQNKADSDERVLIMNLFIGIGKRAIPVVRDRISKVAPWYYLRNLAYILGRIGNESSAGALQPLLLHENKQLRLEALKSIYKTGGKERGPLLLSVLPQADDQFKANIIETLGNAKCAEAVPEFLNMLKKRTTSDPSLRADLEEKICIALGSIGSPEALPTLSKIAKSNFFLPIRRYSKKVKIAAGIAAVSIQKKQEETGGKVKVEEEVNKEDAAKALDAVKISS